MNIKKGIKGRFSFKPPFDKYETNEELEIVYFEKIYIALSNGISVLKLVYNPVGLTKEHMANDIKSDRWLIGLLKSDGGILYLPEQYIVEKENYLGHPYQRFLLSVDVGLLPVDTDFDNLINDIRTLVAERVGVIPYMKVIKVGKIVQYDDNKDLECRIAREIHMVDRGNYKSQIDELERKIEIRDRTIAGLDCVVKELDAP